MHGFGYRVPKKTQLVSFRYSGPVHLAQMHFTARREKRASDRVKEMMVDVNIYEQLSRDLVLDEVDLARRALSLCIQQHYTHTIRVNSCAHDRQFGLTAQYKITHRSIEYNSPLD